MKTIRNFLVGLCALCTISCSIIRPGQVGMKQRLGKLDRTPLAQGAYFFNPFTTTVKRINTRTVEALNDLDVPTHEGLMVKAEIALLYHVKPEAAPDVFVNYGANYQEVIVESNFRAVVRHVTAKYMARELFAVDRKKIENEITDEISTSVWTKGFVVDAVLLKSITMPPQIFQAVENKLKSEQEALQMEFIIAKQKKEAERMQIEAEAIKKYNAKVSESLSDLLVKWNGVQVLKGLVTSPNAKVIITDGKTPMIINDQPKQP
ncbi:MAG: prohibitin family protein [Bacteroidetes bacterium]|nr:prohibitin family protein [Bacteroidota bacterium]